MTAFAPVFRTLVVVLVAVGMAVAVSACDWANVGGPW